MILGVVVRHEHKLRLANNASRGFSGQCWCGYKGPWRGTQQEARDDWGDHMRIEVGALGLCWVYEIRFLSFWSKVPDGDRMVPNDVMRTVPYSVAMAKGVLGYGIDL